jgi:hypothetical protein
MAKTQSNIVFKGMLLIGCIFMFSLYRSIRQMRSIRKDRNVISKSESISPNQDNLAMPMFEIRYRGGPSNHSTSDHPHAGARDENGYWNYIPDVTFFRRNVLKHYGDADSFSSFPLDPDLLEQVCQIAPGYGDEGWEGYKILRHVQVNGPNPVPESVNTTDIMSTLPTNISDLSPPRILCAIYTHDEKSDQIRAMVETWGWRCDGFFAASTKTVTDIAAINLPHRGEESYYNMWQKTRSMLAFMFDNYIDDYDYFYLAGDDTYVIVENLQNYLRLLEGMEGGRDARPLYIGQQIYVPEKWGIEIVYNMGGSGYVLNRLALRRLVLEVLPTCRAEEVTSFEDVNVGRCMLEMGILPVDTADIAHRQRFFDLDPNSVAVRDPATSDQSCVKEIFSHWAKDHGMRHGVDLVSTQAVAFHHIGSPASVLRHHAIFYNSCQRGTVLGDALAEQEKINQ